MTDLALQVTVRGRVQGVSFRAFAREQALAAGLTGWARNRPDGSVDILLCGKRGQVQTVVEALREGPPLARVDSIETREMPPSDARGFAIG